MIFSSLFTFATVSLGLSTIAGIGIAAVGGILAYGGIALSAVQGNKQKNKGINTSAAYSETLST